jgi:paraquat-inducible protein B
MSNRPNPTLVGTFVVGAMVLLVTSVTLFGGAQLFAQKDSYVAYFTENTQGLRKGSNVMVNGVRIGHVSGMALIVDDTTLDSKTEVTIEVLPESYVVVRDGVIVGGGLGGADVDRLINEGGLRALLQVESFVTGQLLVELRFRPETVAVLRGGEHTPYPEIPTVRSEIQELLAKIQSWVADISEGLNAQELGQRIRSTLEGIDELVNSQDLREMFTGINSIVNKKDTQDLTTALQITLQQLQSAAGDASQLFRNVDSTVETLTTDLQPVVKTMLSSLEEVRATMNAAKVQLQGESVASYQLGNTLREVEGAARAMRELLDYLERNPEAILRGKKQ